MLDLDTTLKVAQLESQYPSIPISSPCDEVGSGLNKNGDEFVGNEHFVNPDRQMIYHIHKDPRWKQVLDQFWKAINDRHPPGSG